MIPEIKNSIFSYIQSPTNELMKYVIQDCYKKDFNSYYGEFYCYFYSFQEWYFLYRKNDMYKGKTDVKYQHTPKRIPIGFEKMTIYKCTYVRK